MERGSDNPSPDRPPTPEAAGLPSGLLISVIPPLSAALAQRGGCSTTRTTDVPSPPGKRQSVLLPAAPGATARRGLGVPRSQVSLQVPRLT